MSEQEPVQQNSVESKVGVPTLVLFGSYCVVLAGVVTDNVPAIGAGAVLAAVSGMAVVYRENRRDDL